MPTMQRESHREAIRRSLAWRAGETPDASAVARATFDTWQQMAGLLEPVIGARGADALFGRSLYLTGKDFPWLAASGVHGNSAASLALVKASFEGRETSVATDAGCALLVTFTELLASLIGESLTERLLGVVWTPSPP